MSERDELQQSVERELEDCNRFLKGVQNVVDIVPDVQERKREAEAKKLLLDECPDDLLVEIAPRLLTTQTYNQNRLQSALPNIPWVTKSQYTNTAGSGGSSVFFEAVVAAKPGAGMESGWFQRISHEFGVLAHEKSRKAELPLALARLSPKLETAFGIAVASAEKAKGGILGYDQALIQLRDVVEMIWAELADLARHKCASDIVKRRLEFKQQGDRKRVADCLSPSSNDKTFTILLIDLYQLFWDLSTPAKRLLESDQTHFQELYTRWLLQIDDLCKTRAF